MPSIFQYISGVVTSTGPPRWGVFFDGFSNPHEILRPIFHLDMEGVANHTKPASIHE
jgi:hypothetical protein